MAVGVAVRIRHRSRPIAGSPIEPDRRQLLSIKPRRASVRTNLFAQAAGHPWVFEMTGLRGRVGYRRYRAISLDDLAIARGFYGIRRSPSHAVAAGESDDARFAGAFYQWGFRPSDP